MRHRLVPFCLSSLLLLNLGGCGKNESKIDPFALMEGEGIYKAECAHCHGKDMQGQPGWQSSAAEGKPLGAPPLAGDSPVRGKPFAELVATVRRGNMPGQAGEHPAFAGKLTERQMENVILFIQSRWSAPTR